MSLRRFLPTNRNPAAQSSLGTPTYTSNVTTPPTHTDGANSLNGGMRALSGSDSVRRRNKSSLTDTLDVADTSEVATRYIYYRIYAEDGAIPSKTSAAPGDPFLGRIKAIYVPPPYTAKAVKRSIAKVEDIEDRTNTSLFLTPYSQSFMGNADKVTILNRTGLGSTPHEPLALVAKMSDSERSALESGGRGGLASAQAAEPPEIRYLYYRLYADDYAMPSKVAIDPEEPFVGRIRADSVAPPHSPASIKRCISRVEKTPALAHADLFADVLCDFPLKEGHISILHADGPGLTPNDPMAIVRKPIEGPSIQNGKYAIKNRAADIYWNTGVSPFAMVHFWATTIEQVKKDVWSQWDIIKDTDGYISISSRMVPLASPWVGANITWSTVSVPWRLITADSKSYHLTTDMNCVSQNARVLAAQHMSPNSDSKRVPGLMSTLKEGDRWQMWEFIPI